MDSITPIIESSLQKLIDNSTSPRKLMDLKKRHQAKVHFIPVKYRIFGGILQSMNIQFGNFIEELIPELAEKNKEANIEFLPESGTKNVRLSIDEHTNALIDNYIEQRQHTASMINFHNEFAETLSKIRESEYSYPNPDNVIIHDIDLLFKDKKTGFIYYIEVKYTDDHDTGKFIDINRKFLKTYAGLINYLGPENGERVIPYLYYFNRTVKKINNFVCEDTNILRGQALFERFLDVSYNELDNALKSMSEDIKVISIFDNLYREVTTPAQ